MLKALNCFQPAARSSLWRVWACLPQGRGHHHLSLYSGRSGENLHPKIFGGILGRRDVADDAAQMQQYDIPAIDLVIVDLYPFEQTVASGASEAEIIEKIDIGGISLIRAGAKNFKDVVIVPSKAEYQPLLELLQKQGAQTEIEQRRWFATRAFGVSSHYDTAIHAYFEKTAR
mgnify:CR=1 FL=1